MLSTAYSVDAHKQKWASSGNANRSEGTPIHLVVRSSAEIKQTFTYSPYPAVPSELEGYAGSQVGGTGTYRLTIDAQGAVTQVTILKGFTVTAISDERFSNVKGSTVPALQCDGSGFEALASEIRTAARRGYLSEFWNTSMGELREIECVTVVACSFAKRRWD